MEKIDKAKILLNNSVVLPDNYNQTIMTWELKFDKGDRNIETIRNLLYLYSLGMEYYDSTNNNQAYQYYCTKNNKILTDESVINSIEKIKGIKQNPITLFENKDYTVYHGNYSKKEEEFFLNDIIDNKSNYSIETLNKISSNKKRLEVSKIKMEAENIIKLAYNDLSSKYNNLSKNIIQQLNLQNKQLFDKINSLPVKNINISTSNSNDLKIIQKKSLNSSKSKKRKSSSNSKLSDMKLQHALKNEATAEKVLLQLLEEEENIDKQMENEIANYINKSEEELKKECKDIRDSYKQDIEGFEEMGNEYVGVVEGMKEDMENEIDNLKLQFEEKRRVEIEKIHKKYK